MKQNKVLITILLFFLITFIFGKVSTKSDLNYGHVAYYIMYFTNIERLKHGLPMFRYNPILQAGAQRHSQYMADHQYMSHSESILRNPQDTENSGKLLNRKDKSFHSP